MNTTRRYSASSSSSDDVDSSNASFDRCEDHSKKCNYKILKGRVAGTEVWIHFRLCKCGIKTNRRNELAAKRLDQQDGVEQHFSVSCRWRRRKSRIYSGTVYKLQRYCVCNVSGHPTTNGHMNSKS
ncbi:hypothetical protein DPMN_136133 [Dreissena polymorpha]|uniref:Uncharacterized protein n=1 Tax=Dreissena polymorpha TaxID=45954 RepID=A0A9D4JDH9_DREPO|nr:hypothetical protein DPMN_136133 [Dreissena polymorpha]